MVHVSAWGSGVWDFGATVLAPAFVDGVQPTYSGACNPRVLPNKWP